MNHKKIFERKLEELFHTKTHSIRKEMGLKNKGKSENMSRPEILKVIDELKEEAVKIRGPELIREAFKNHAPSKKSWRVKGVGYKNKKEKFKKWCEKKLPREQSFIYVFWNKNLCLYVGRTERGISRPSAHFREADFKFTTRVDIYPVSKSLTTKLECIGIHRWKPKINGVKASDKKYAKYCPIHRICDNLETDLKNIFRIKH